ncbi:MAG TPA: CRISPR-associated helicase Cas3' [Propioniciclava sp.]|uniref:CRISPR-associated helicase Cas3' n=1 Tax=Propioniciclava sp. TaxID=2038686 RepID=UPI002B62944F|nr:CRISPR-associated helicase Cas3' [Propioniciclava sp.]HRL80484.1 CRISPR-associated helicase Cas3' [Propioniciclava sp.]
MDASSAPRTGPGSPWSDAALSAWGKTDPASGQWFPVVHHLTDSAAMAGDLFDHYLPAATQTMLADLAGVSIAEARALASFLAGVHDIGKITPQFASQVSHTFPTVLAGMRRHGLDASRPYPDRIPHATLSQVIVQDWLRSEYGADPRTAATYACIVGGHHGRNPSKGSVAQARNSAGALGSGAWADVRREVLLGIGARTGIGAIWPTLAARRLPPAAQSVLIGLVIMADWMASNTDYFPYDGALDTATRLEQATDLLALPRPWASGPGTTDATTLLHQRFPQLAQWPARGIQRALVEASQAARSAPLLIVEAPMGVGKTEGALLASEVLASRFGQGGVFLGLPTMATANPMFTRTMRWLDHALGEDASVALTHGKAGLNDEYASLLRASWHGDIHDGDDADESRAVVNQWLRGAKRAGLSSFVIGTVDQALFAALKAKHVALRHLGLAGKVVIIDEVHSADAYMREYLHRLLAWLAAWRVPVIVMSATLPPAQREGFVAAYARGAGDPHPTPPDPGDAYPRITLYDGSTHDLSVAPDTRSTQVALERIGDDPGLVADRLSALLVEGGCAGVVCNTVGRAQEVFDALRGSVPDEELILIHSRFLAPERLAREADLVSKLGNAPDAHRPRRLIVVGTQVLEQSLDIDFDVLISDVAPIDLLLQRVGRLHRHQRSTRPRPVDEPVLLVRGVTDWESTPPSLARSTTAIYGAAPILRAAALLGERSSVTLPDDIAPLVRRGYDPALPPPPGWETLWSEAEQAAAQTLAAKRQRAQSYLLPAPSAMSSLDGWIDVDSGDPERAEREGHAQVRDSEDSLEVIVVDRVGDELRMPAASAFPGMVIPHGQMWGTGPDAPYARALAACTLRLPQALCHEGTIGPLIDALEGMVDASGWQQSPWLRGQLVLPFDEHGNVAISLPRGGNGHTDSYLLHYDSVRGLTAEKARDH